MRIPCVMAMSRKRELVGETVAETTSRSACFLHMLSAQPNSSKRPVTVGGCWRVEVWWRCWLEYVITANE